MCLYGYLVNQDRRRELLTRRLALLGSSPLNHIFKLQYLVSLRVAANPPQVDPRPPSSSHYMQFIVHHKMAKQIGKKRPLFQIKTEVKIVTFLEDKPPVQMMDWGEVHDLCR